MTKIYKIKLAKKDLDDLPELERKFLLQILNIANDINCLQKIILHSLNGIVNTGPNVELTNMGQNIQSISTIILFAGRLYEGYMVLKNDFCGSSLSKNFYPKLSPKGQECYKNLKKGIGEKSLFYYIRNKFSFHYDTEALNNQLGEYKAEVEFDLFIAENFGNCLFTTSTMIFHHILKRVDPSFDINANFEIDLEAQKKFVEATEKVLDLIKKMAKDFQILIVDCLKVIAEENKWELEEVVEPEFTEVNKIKIPYFIK